MSRFGTQSTHKESSRHYYRMLTRNRMKKVEKDMMHKLLKRYVDNPNTDFDNFHFRFNVKWDYQHDYNYDWVVSVELCTDDYFDFIQARVH